MQLLQELKLSQASITEIYRTEMQLGSLFSFLANLTGSNVAVARDCALSAFHFHPTTERLEQLKVFQNITSISSMQSANSENFGLPSTAIKTLLSLIVGNRNSESEFVWEKGWDVLSAAYERIKNFSM